MTSDVRPLHQAVERLQHQALALRIQRAGGLVQDQDRRVAQDGAGDGHALPLPAGQLHAALADARLIALRKGADEVVGVGLAGRLDHLRFRRARPAVGDVVEDRAAEQQHVLRHHRHLLAQMRAGRTPARRGRRSGRGRRPARRSAAAATRPSICPPRSARPGRCAGPPAPPDVRRAAPPRPAAMDNGRRRSRRPHRRAVPLRQSLADPAATAAGATSSSVFSPSNSRMRCVAPRRAESDYTGRQTIPSPRPRTSCTA